MQRMIPAAPVQRTAVDRMAGDGSYMKVIAQRPE